MVEISLESSPANNSGIDFIITCHLPLLWNPSSLGAPNLREHWGSTGIWNTGDPGRSRLDTLLICFPWGFVLLLGLLCFFRPLEWLRGFQQPSLSLKEGFAHKKRRRRVPETLLFGLCTKRRKDANKEEEVQPR